MKNILSIEARKISQKQVHFIFIFKRTSKHKAGRDTSISRLGWYLNRHTCFWRMLWF